MVLAGTGPAPDEELRRMARAITRDPREYRRGMVLGLTLAETMLLLLFLLMMVAAALLWRASEEMRDTRDHGDVAAAHAADQMADLARRLDRASAVEAERDALREAPARAEAAAAAEAAARQRAETRALPRDDARRWREAGLQDVLAEAHRLDPSRSPEQVLTGLVAHLRRQPEAGRPGAVDALGARLQDAREAETRLASLQTEIERLRAALARQGGGEVYPSCWVSAGRAEHAFEVVLRNDGLVEVQDLAPPARRSQEPWTSLGPFPRGQKVPIEIFLAAVRGMAEWSVRQRPECRFHVRVRNGLRPGSPMEEYNRVIGPLGNAASRHLPFYRLGG
jgi:hypothetical protein